MPRASARPIAGTHDPRVYPSQPQQRPVLRRAAHRQFGLAIQGMIAAGQRPCVRVVVGGFDGILVHLAIDKLPGAIAHARTRRRAREIARASVASIFELDPISFDLEVVGA